MEFTAEEIKEFQDIIKVEYGVVLSEGAAITMAKRLLSLYEIIARPLPEEIEAIRPGSSPLSETSESNLGRIDESA